MDTISEFSFEAIAIEKSQEELEIFLFAVMGCRCHKQQVASMATNCLARTVTLGLFDLPPGVTGTHAVRLVDDNEIPFWRP